MRLSVLVSTLCAAAAEAIEATTHDPEFLFANPARSDEQHHTRIPTSYESAVLGRRILALTPLATLATVFPEDKRGAGAGVGAQENRPEGLGGVPIGLMDYVADCEDEGNPTILAINIATAFKNVKAGSNISLSQEWTPRYPPNKRIKSSMWERLFGRAGSDDNDDDDYNVPYSAANLPRFSLIGYLEGVDAGARSELAACFTDKHPDAKFWLPGNRIHSSEFVRLVVTHIYWIGGFGDRAYIGWIDPAEWNSVSREEWESVRLPGEKKGWDEWSVRGLGDL